MENFFPLQFLVLNYPTSLPIGRHKSLKQEPFVPSYTTCVLAATALYTACIGYNTPPNYLPYFLPPPLSVIE